MNNSKKVAVITGGSQGIGAALVKAYRAQNYCVVTNSRSIAASSDPEIITVAGDIADRSVARRIVEEAVTKFGRIDTLVNNAGVFRSRPFISYDDDDFVRAMNTNLVGFFHISQLVIEKMLERKYGHVVNITTTLVDQPMAAVPSALTSLTKGGLNAVAKSLAIEYASQGIRVNAVSPGIIKTNMNPPEAYDYLAQFHPVGRMGEIHDVVEAVLYLERAAFVTGEILHVDGGQSAGRW